MLPVTGTGGHTSALCVWIKVYRSTLSCLQQVHTSDGMCACKGQENAILLVRQNSSRLQRRNPIITPRRPCVLLVENRWVREPTGWKNLADGQRVQGWEGPTGTKLHSGTTLYQSFNDANGEWAESEATCRNSFHTHANVHKRGPRPWLLWHLLVNWEHQTVLQKLAVAHVWSSLNFILRGFSNSTARKIMASCSWHDLASSVQYIMAPWIHGWQTYFFELFLLWFLILIAVILFIAAKRARKHSDVILSSCEH